MGILIITADGVFWKSGNLQLASDIYGSFGLAWTEVDSVDVGRYKFSPRFLGGSFTLFLPHGVQIQGLFQGSTNAMIRALDRTPLAH